MKDSLRYAMELYLHGKSIEDCIEGLVVLDEDPKTLLLDLINFAYLVTDDDRNYVFDKTMQNILKVMRKEEK